MTSQAEYWNEAGGAAWVRGQALLDAQLAPVGALALDAAAAKPGEAALDVGCGCGATTADLAAAVGPNGRVVGVDLSAPMIVRAREWVAAPQVEFKVGDAASVALPGRAFDLLFSRLGVMFFDEPVRAFAHLRTALRPGGRVSLAVWQSIEANPWLAVPMASVAGLVELPALGGPDEPGPFSFAAQERVETLLGAAGFGDVALTGHIVDLAIGGGLALDGAVGCTIEHGPLRRVLEPAPPPVRAAATERIAAALAPYDGPNGVHLPAGVWVVTASA